MFLDVFFFSFLSYMTVIFLRAVYVWWMLLTCARVVTEWFVGYVLGQTDLVMNFSITEF